MPRLLSLFLPFLFFPAPGGASLPLFLFHAPPALTFPAFSLLFRSRRGISAPFSFTCPARTHFSRFFSSFPLQAGHPSLFFSPMPRPDSLFPLFLFFSAPGGASQPLFLSHAPLCLTFPAFSLLFCSRRGIQAFFSLPCPAWCLISFKPLFFPAKVNILSSQGQLPPCYKIVLQNPQSTLLIPSPDTPQFPVFHAGSPSL